MESIIDYDEFENCHPLIGEVIGYLALEMPGDATSVFHGLPEAVREHPGLHRLRLRVATATGDFSRGAELAWRGLLPKSEDRGVAGRYLAKMARHHLNQDEVNSATVCQFLSCTLNPNSGMVPIIPPDWSPESVTRMLEEIEASCLKGFFGCADPMKADEVATLLDAL